MTVTDLTFEQSKNNPCITRGIHTWECDLIQFRKKFGEANVTSLVERVSRLPSCCATMIGSLALS